MMRRQKDHRAENNKGEKMKKIIERTKFAIAWQKTNKDQDRDEHDGQVRPNWRYGY